MFIINEFKIWIKLNVVIMDSWEREREREIERSELKENPSVDNFLQLSQICIQEENYSQVQEIFIKQVIILVCVQRSIVQL